MRYVYSPANLDWQQVSGTPQREGPGSQCGGEAWGALLALTCFHTCWGCCSYRLPLIQAPSLEFIIPALVLTSQKLPMAIQTSGNGEYREGQAEEGLGVQHLSTGRYGCRTEAGQCWNCQVL